MMFRLQKIILAVCVLLIGGINSFAAQPSTQKSAAVLQFHEAGIAYKAEDYKKAIELYEGIIQSGWMSGPIYYNLGNSYFKDKQLGKAILNYERARQLMPRDADLIANNKYAVSQIPNYSLPMQSVFQRIFDRYLNFMTVDEMTWVVFYCFLITGVIFCLGLFLRWSLKVRLWLVTLNCCLLFVHTFFLGIQLTHAQNDAVIIEKTSAKFEPIDDATTYFDLTEGWKVQILKKETGWVKVKRLDRKIGWVKTEAVESI